MGTFPQAFLGLGDSLELLRDSLDFLVLEAEEHSQEQLLQVFLSPFATKLGFEAFV